ncbi:hypothetical protein ACOSQ2_004257 [Xanthoceras sorbifolium]
MASGVDSTAQMRRVRRQRRPSRRNEAGSAGVSTTETIPAKQQTMLTDADGGPKKWFYKCAPEKWFVARVNMYCRIGELGTLRDILRKDNMLDKWTHSAFGRLSGMRGDQLFSGKLCHSLLCREIHYPGAREDEIWFDIGGHAIRFGKEEFLLCTGLKFGPLPGATVSQNKIVDDSVHSRLFDGLPTLIESVLVRLNEGGFTTSDDAIKLAYVFFVSHILLGREKSRIVPPWLWGLVDDLTAFEAFPWGTYVYSFTLYWLGKALSSRSSSKIKKETKKKNTDTVKSQLFGYNVHGFAWALQIWALEAIPCLTGVIGTSDGDGLPRCTRWFSRKKPTSLDDKLNSETRPLRTLTASNAEKATDYYSSFDPDQLVGPKLHMEGGLGNHFDNDEEHVDNVSEKEPSDDILQWENRSKATDDRPDQPNKRVPSKRHTRRIMDNEQVRSEDSMRSFVAHMVQELRDEIRTFEARTRRLIYDLRDDLHAVFPIVPPAPHNHTKSIEPTWSDIRSPAFYTQRKEFNGETAVSDEKVGDGPAIPPTRAVFEDRASDDLMVDLTVETGPQLPKVVSPAPNIETVNCEKSVQALEKHQFMREDRKQEPAAACKTSYTATCVKKTRLM